jgi:hypothetical protein
MELSSNLRNAAVFSSEIRVAVRRKCDDPRAKLSALRCRLCRELREMRDLWRIPVRMTDAHLVAKLGAEPHTPLDEAVRTMLAGLKCLPIEGARR